MNFHALLAELWPNWKATMGQATEYRDRLSQKNPGWLESAIRDHYSLDCPKDGVFIEPRLSKILSRYAAIAEAGEHAQDRRNAAGVRYRAAWVQRRHGMPYAMASAQTFPFRQQALEHAAERGERPDAIPVGGTDSDDRELDLVMADDRVMRNALARLPADRLEQAIAETLELPLGLTRASVQGDVMDWPRFVVGVVHSVHERQ